MEARTLFSTISFAAHSDFAAGTSPVALATADFNNDGNKDLAVADSTGNTVTVYFGNGAGGFTAGPSLQLSAPPSAIITGDFNGDHNVDIAVGCTAGVGQSNTSVTVFLNNGAGGFSAAQMTTVETNAFLGEPVRLAAADFNADSKLDLAVTDYNTESISILFGAGNGTFAAPINYQADAHPTAIAVADFNSDSYPDLAVASTLTDFNAAAVYNTVSILLGSSTGDLSAGTNLSIDSGTNANSGSSTIGSPTAITAINLTGDQTPGVVIGNSDRTAVVIANNQGLFSQTAFPTLSAGSTGIAAADFDLDGNTDFVSADGGVSAASSSNSVTIVPGAGAGMVSATSMLATAAHPVGVVTADFNNDGKPDIATVNQSTAQGGSSVGSVSILLNTSSIALQATQATLAADQTSVAAGSSLNLTASVTLSSTGTLPIITPPGGLVSFYENSTLLGTAPIAPTTGQAVFSTTSLGVGIHHIYAVYAGDSTYTGSTSVKITVMILPTATQGPDLIGSVVSTTFSSLVAPGEVGTVIVRVTNQGNAPAVGAITNQAFLSLDSQLDAGDQSVIIRGVLARTSLKLQPNQSILLRGTLTIPTSAALATDTLLFSLNATSTLAESITTNDLLAAPATVQVANVFGNIGGHASVVLRLADNHGTLATFKLTGPGVGTIDVGDNGIDLVLDQTTAATVVTITPTSSAILQIHDVSSTSPVGSLKSPHVDVGHAISFPGGIGLISLDGFGAAEAPTNRISIGGTVPTSLTIGSIPSGSLSTTAGIRAISVGNWGTGQISAPWIGTIKSRGDFNPGLVLTGDTAPAGIALNTVAVTGTVGDSSAGWIIAGATNRLSAGAYATDWIFRSTGAIKSFISAASFVGSVSATSLGTIRIRGGVSHSTFTAASIAAVSVSGPADSFSRFIAAQTPKRANLGGVTVDPGTDFHFEK